MSADGFQVDARSTPAMASGPGLPPKDSGPVSLVAGIKQRLAQLPNARLWTVDGQGRPVPAAYADLWRRSGALARGLTGAGVGPGQVVALLIDHVPDSVAAMWACIRLGCTFLPLGGRARRALCERRPDALNEVLLLAPDAVLLADTMLGSVAGMRRRLDLATIEASGEADAGRTFDQPAAAITCLLPTSGSTGRVKLAKLGEAALLARRFRRRGGNADAEAVPLWVYDTDSVTGLNAAFVHAADWIQIPPSAMLARPALVLDVMHRLRVSRLALTCSLAGLLAHAAETWLGEGDLAPLRRVTMGGEAVDAGVAGRLRDVLVRHGARQVCIRVGYGTTETGSLAEGADVRADGGFDLGPPAAGVSLRVVDESGRILPEGSVGEIEALCPELVFSGYAGEADTGFTQDGWWRTGDLGRFDGGRLSLHGRGKDVVAVRGNKLSLTAIESVMQAAVDAIVGPAACRLFACAIPMPGQAGEALAVVVFDHTPDAKAVDRTVRRAIAERFGIQPQRIVHRSMADLPLGTGGKVLRRELARQVSETPVASARGRYGGPENEVKRLWHACLPHAGAAQPDSHFFEEGGDSLAAHQLLAGFESAFGAALSPADFFAEPTFGTLLSLAMAAVVEPQPIPESPRWPLPAAVHDKLLATVEPWSGSRPTSDRLMAGLNLTGTLPPLFWVFQAAQEFAALARALGPEQPLYGFRSGHRVYGYDEDSLQQIALRYVQDIVTVCPLGPLYVGGNCQGGRVALAMAEHLLRRRVALPVLFLMEWGFAIPPYGGDIVFLHGADSLEGNPWLRHEEPDRAWRRMLRRCEAEMIPGRHGQYFQPEHVPHLAATLSRLMMQMRTPDLMPALARRADLRPGEVPTILSAGQRHVIDVEVRNASPMAWLGAWGLRLGNYWLNDRHQVDRWRDGRIPLPELEPGESIGLRLEVTAPAMPGRSKLVLDIVEEGSGWFDRRRTTCPVLPVEVIPPRVVGP